MKKRNYYLGLDIGTDSVGYAATDKEYNLLRFHGNDAWGVTIFDEAMLNSERRSFRTARRRLDRRQQRVTFIQELFADEIKKIDSNFYSRIKASRLFIEDKDEPYTLFNDSDFTDKEYYEEYPTIHHLIFDLMNSKETHDIRLVYIACAWLVAHRGHFLKNIEKTNISKIRDFDTVYADFLSYFENDGIAYPWECSDVSGIGAILKKKQNVTAKNKDLIALLFNGKKPSKEATEDFPFSREAMVKLLAGGTCKLKDLFCNDDYSEAGSLSLGMDDDKMAAIAGEIGDDYDLIDKLRLLYDWAQLNDMIGEYETISEAKVADYNRHKNDLKILKHIIKKYLPEKYNSVFRDVLKDNYVAYSHHSDETDTSKLKSTNKEDFSKFVLGTVKNIVPDDEDRAEYDDMISRLEMRSFMPKQKTTDNRVIPYQLYWYELDKILKNAEAYLPFLAEKDSDGLTVSDKILSVFTFKIPYYVGPLNADSKYAWIKRKADGKIYPWNFEEKIDLDESENAFIKRMTNKCTYLPGEDVLPKDSLCYHKFTVLNEINNLRINGERISVELKQEIFNELFMKVKKVTRKKLLDYLIINGYLEKGEEELLTGIDIQINSNLSTHIAFARLLESGILTEGDVERIIERASYAEDKTRLLNWLEREYPSVSETDRKYIASVKIKDFGRLSRKFLEETYGTNKTDGTGEALSVLGALWNTQYNLMELLSDKFSFADAVKAYCDDYYVVHKPSLSDRLDEMYISNAVKRPVYRTLDIVRDVVKAFGVPEKIFVEMARGASPDQKGKRTKTRKQQILEFYEQCEREELPILKKQLEEMGEYVDNKLQSDKLFLYFMQLGKSMYSGKPIDISRIGEAGYCDIEHIYPQAYVKDDSIINNEVLVFSEENGDKSDTYPIKESVRSSMHGFWSYLRHAGLISEEKYKRLTRATPFTEDEKYGFINRQLTETSQSTKAVATILNELYPETEIVYCKSRLASEFRHEFNVLKSRKFNDLHHAVDAYLNIVTGNVYNMKFTKKWFNVASRYSIKTKTIFTNPVVCDKEVVWDGENMLGKVKRIAVKNTAHFTKYSFFKKGGFFDQMPVSASEGLTPLKKGLETEKYGGYNKAGVMFFIPVKYSVGKKTEIIIMSVELLYGKKFLSNSDFAKEYTFKRLVHILGKPVDSVSFPMGMRPWKVNTMLSLDGFRVCIAGSASRGRCLIAQPVMQFSESGEWQYYLKKLEMFSEKCTNNENYIYDEEFDKVSDMKNVELYDIYLEKFRNSIYSKRVNTPTAILEKGREKFISLDIKKQSLALLNIHQTFGRISGGCDLTAIGGAGKAAATVNFSSSISNWKKTYKDVRIIDQSSSGLWEKKSENLLELL